MQRFGFALTAALVAVLTVAAGVFAASGDPVTDYSSYLTSNIGDLVVGVAASIAAVFAVAVAIRITFRAARLGLKALGFIK